MIARTSLFLFLALCVAGCRSTSDLDVVTGFDAKRYMGVWYEAARLPHRFEKDMSHVTATYSIKDDGMIRVLNRGFHTGRGEWEEIEGVAKFKGDPDAGWLKVSFFKPFYASYKIIYLDDQYTRAIVTGPSYGYLWILTRDPALPSEELEGLVEKVQAFGFDTEELIIVDQTELPE